MKQAIIFMKKLNISDDDIKLLLTSVSIAVSIKTKANESLESIIEGIVNEIKIN